MDLIKPTVGICAAAMLLAATPANAETQSNPDAVGAGIRPAPRVAPPGVVPDPVPDINTGALTLSGGADWTTAYFFRGFLQENRGLILQPWAELGIGLIDSGNYTLTANIGMWNSFHTRPTGAPAGAVNRSWYEADFYGGLDLEIADFNLGVLYTHYIYPGQAAGSIGEIGFTVAYDDSALWGNRGFALHPHAGIFFETSGSSNAFAVVGLEPSYELADLNLTLTAPVEVGLSLDDYYVDAAGRDQTVGYVSVGLFGSIPLPMPDRYGNWTLTAGVTYLHLNARALRQANRGDRNEVIGTVGVAFSY